MAASDRALLELDCGNLAKEWPNWKSSFLMYMLSSGKSLESEQKKIATFLWLIGSQAVEIYATLFPNDGTEEGITGIREVVSKNKDGETERKKEQKVTLKDVLVAFDKYCIPQKNTTMESFKYNKIKQSERQCFVDFETQLRKQIQYCGFKCECGVSYEDRMLKDRIIIGVHDKKLQLKLLETDTDDVKKVLEICKAFETANDNKEVLEKNNVQSVHSNVQNNHVNVDRVATRCFNCGAEYTPDHLRVCKAKNVTCRACGKVGHFQKHCNQQFKKNNERKEVETKRSKVWGNNNNNNNYNKNKTRSWTIAIRVMKPMHCTGRIQVNIQQQQIMTLSIRIILNYFIE